MNIRHAVAAGVALFAAACAVSSTFPTNPPILRPADDPPAQFLTAEGAAGVENACRNPLIDPRDQTRLRLVRSGSVGGSHHGDYDVPDGRYGTGPNELLRIDCGTGRAVGIVAT
ncbi:MAG TPA: hypothetical protein VHG09_10345 [Longimicrobiales bacterium]|nr:hypothetical protein [Longimicrobiales bacterium]